MYLLATQLCLGKSYATIAHGFFVQFKTYVSSNHGERALNTSSTAPLPGAFIDIYL